MFSYEHFGECFKHILESRCLSVLEASRLLGIKSPTTLFRIIHNEVSYKAIHRFYTNLLENPRFSLLPEEKERLERALRISRVGPEEYLTYRSMWRFLLPDAKDAAVKALRIVCFGSRLPADIRTFDQLTAFYAQCRDVQLTLSACCLPAVLSPILSLLQNAGAEHQVHLTHYLNSQTDSPHSLVDCIAAIRPLLTLPNYSAYMPMRSVMPAVSISRYKSNEILCSFVDKQGKRRLHHGVLTGPETMLLIEYQNEVPFSFQLTRLDTHRDQLSPIKAIFPVGGTPQDYVIYTENYRQLEEGKAIYSIKPDVPLDFIHPDLVLEATMNGFRSEGLVDADALEPLVMQLYQIQLMRWQNIFEKKKVTHIVFSPRAMANFAQTGVQSDHFFAMSPYSPPKRREILLFLRRQMLENPYFNLYFSADDALTFQLEITGYDDQNVLLTDAHTGYNLAHGHVETMITQQQFCQAFCQFFMNELLTDHVLPSREALALMDRLIASVPEEA